MKKNVTIRANRRAAPGQDMRREVVASLLDMADTLDERSSTRRERNANRYAEYATELTRIAQSLSPSDQSGSMEYKGYEDYNYNDDNYNDDNNDDNDLNLSGDIEMLLQQLGLEGSQDKPGHGHGHGAPSGGPGAGMPPMSGHGQDDDFNNEFGDNEGRYDNEGPYDESDEGLDNDRGNGLGDGKDYGRYSEQ